MHYHSSSPLDLHTEHFHSASKLTSESGNISLGQQKYFIRCKCFWRATSKNRDTTMTTIKETVTAVGATQGGKVPEERERESLSLLHKHTPTLP